MDQIKIITDTDNGRDMDEAFCLAYLLRQPVCDLLWITTCSSDPGKRAAEHHYHGSIRRYLRYISLKNHQKQREIRIDCPMAQGSDFCRLVQIKGLDEPSPCQTGGLTQKNQLPLILSHDG